MRYLICIVHVLFVAQFATAQKVEFKKYVFSYTLPPVLGAPLSVSKNLTTFQYRAFGNGTAFIPAQNPVNFLGKELKFTVDGWLQVKENPQFYLDFYYDAPTVVEEKVVEMKNQNVLAQSPTVKVYQINYTMGVKMKIVSASNELLGELTFPSESLTYDFYESDAVALGYKPIPLVSFQSNDEIFEVAKVYRNQILRTVELEGAYHYTLKQDLLTHKLHDYFYFQLFPHVGKDNIELATIVDIQNSAFSHLKLDEADKLAKEYYDYVQLEYGNWEVKRDLIFNAMEIWIAAIGHLQSLEKLPLHKELTDALAFNMSVGLTYLNSFELAETTIKLLNSAGSYGIGIGKAVRQEKMMARANEQRNQFISARRKIAKIRGWKKLA